MAGVAPVEGRVGARIATLDGWRGIAILLVLADHAAYYTRFHSRLWAGQGGFGVDIFFVISGYIITAGLIAERAKLGTICLKNFYLRRARRILPLVITYLAFLTLFCSNFITRSELLGSLFFFRNYQLAVHPGGIYTFHFWSLAIEEQFYILWPALLLFLGNKRAMWFALCAAISCALWRFHDYSGSWLSHNRLIRTDTRIDGLMLGCALALLLAQPKVRSFVFRNFPKEAPIFCGFPIVFLVMNSIVLPSFALYAIIAVAMASTLVVEEGLAHKWLNLRPLVWVGRISFSLYVWQQLFLMRPEGISGIPAPLNLICAFLVAIVSFYFIEQPLRKQSFWKLLSNSVTTTV